MKNAKRIANLFTGFMGIVISCLILFGKWMYIKDLPYTIPGFYSNVKQYGGILKFAELVDAPGADRSIIPAYLFLAFLLVSVILLVIRTILAFLNKRTWWLSVIVYWLGFLNLLSLFGFCSYTPGPALTITMILMVFDYLGMRYILERNEMIRRARELKHQEALARADKKRRLRFPGRYSKDFFQVIFANFRSNLKSYLLFIIAASASFTLFYVMFGAQAIIDASSPDRGLLLDDRIIDIFKEVIPIIIFLSLMLFVLIISNYIKTRMKNYSIFISLGIRRKTLWMVIALEYLACILTSIAAGLILGNILLPLIKLFYLHSMGITTSISTPYGMIILVTFIIFLLIVGLATLVNYHLFEGSDITAAFVKATRKEKLPSHLLIPGLIYGIYTIYNAIEAYLTGYWIENTSEIFSLFWGCLFLLYCGGSKLIRWYTKKKDRYLKNIFKLLPWKYRFKTNARYLLILFAVHVLALAIYVPRLSSCLIAGQETKLFPYDFVCMTEANDNAFFQTLEEDYDLQMARYPMIRINTLLAEPYSFDTLRHTSLDGMIFPPGQHIGISETTYMKLKTALHPDDTDSPNLDGRDIHVVFQQDTSQRARLLDWYYYPMGESNHDGPHLKAGNLVSYNLLTRDELYPQYHIKSQEKLILTGMIKGGDQEDIVVFSDDYFNELYQSVTEQTEEGPSPTQLITIQTGIEEHNNVSQSLMDFSRANEENAQTYSSTLIYDKESALSAVPGERFFKGISALAAICILLISSLFIFYLKYSLETDEMTRRNQLLESVGMKSKDRVRFIRDEMSIHSRWAFVIAAGTSALYFLTLPGRRFYSGTETLYYFLIFLILLAVYTLLYGAGIHLLERHFIQEINNAK